MLDHIDISQLPDKILDVLSCMTEADYASFRRRVRDGLVQKEMSR